MSVVKGHSLDNVNKRMCSVKTMQTDTLQYYVARSHNIVIPAVKKEKSRSHKQ